MFPPITSTITFISVAPLRAECIGILALPKINFAQTPDLGTASGFALFTAVGAFNNTGATNVTGNIGTNVGAFTGFPPGTFTGEINMADATSTQAALDVNTYLKKDRVQYNDIFII